MELYSNILSFIKFSGLNPDMKEINYIESVGQRKPVRIEVNNRVVIMVYYKSSKSSTEKDIGAMLEKSDKEYILIKSLWQKKSYRATLMLLSDFKNNVAAPYIFNNIRQKKLTKEEIEEEFDFYKIDPNNLPKINKSDMLAKWLLMKEGDVVKYYIAGDNYNVKYRICI